jgi:putative flippase GtrA
VNSRRLLRELASFAAVGVAATATHYAVALGLNGLLHVAPLKANIAAYLCAVIVSYLGNARLTFRAGPLGAAQFARFAAVSLTGFAINQAVVWAGLTWAGWPYAVALVPALLLAAAATFALAKLWAFGAPDPAP